ncbi:MAG: hypothetical protein A2096_04885 [Spirochaetes bacterium GWF1_41_5]|nr:MAG: hypothetical protein A2096_04885 [Spirochaetes bacterium GWF1_41_5]
MLPVSDAQAGLVFNYFDIKNYFCIFISAGETNNCILKKIINGREQIIKKAGWSIQTDKWYALCLQNTNGTISFKLNDNSLFSNITDHSIEQGKIGLITQNNSGVYFDNVDVVFY